MYKLTPGISFVSFAMIAGLVQSVDVGAFFSPLSITRIIHPPLPSVTQCFTVFIQTVLALSCLCFVVYSFQFELSFMSIVHLDE